MRRGTCGQAHGLSGRFMDHSILRSGRPRAASVPPGVGLLRALEWNHRAIKCVAFDPELHKLAGGGLDGTVAVWDTANGRVLRTFERSRGTFEWQRSGTSRAQAGLHNSPLEGSGFEPSVPGGPRRLRRLRLATRSKEKSDADHEKLPRRILSRMMGIIFKFQEDERFRFASSTAATRANLLLSFSSAAAMRANLSFSCSAAHSIEPRA
jgi:hypothetical protein